MTSKTTTRSLSSLAALALAAGTVAVMAPAAQAAPADAAMVPTDLTRIVDSREAVGAADEMINNEQIDIQITGEVDTIDGTTKTKQTVVPKGASAVVLNMTAVDAAEAGYFVAWTAGDDRPTTSNINFVPGDIVANGAVIPLGADGKISVFSRGSADILLDVAGYYKAGQFVASTPDRLFDSDLLPQATVGAKSITRVKASDEAGDIVTLNITSDAAMGEGYATVWTTQEDVAAGDDASLAGMPATSNLNYGPGRIVANTVTVKTGVGGYVSIYSMAEHRLIVDRVMNLDADDNADAYAAHDLLDRARRVMDTRSAIGSSEKTGYRKLDLLEIADSVDELGSIMLQVTVDNAEADGFISVGPNLEANGIGTSVLNYKAGQIVSNRVMIPASYLGELEVYSHSSTDVIVDVMGYTVPSNVTPEPALLDLSAAKGTADFPATSLGTIGGSTVLSLNSDTVADGGDIPNGFKVADTNVTITAKYTSANSTTIALEQDEVADNLWTLDLGGLKPDTYTATVKLAPISGSSTTATTASVSFMVTDPAASNGQTSTSTGSVVANSRLDYDATEGTPGAAASFTVTDGGTSTGYTVALDAEYADAAAKLTAINTALDGSNITASFDGSGNLVLTDADDAGAPSVGGADVATEFGTGTESDTLSGTTGNDTLTGDVVANTRLDYVENAGTPNAAATITVDGTDVSLAADYADADAKLTAINDQLTGITASYSTDGYLVFSQAGAAAPTVTGANEFGTASTAVAGVPMDMFGSFGDAVIEYDTSASALLSAFQPLTVKVPAPYLDGGAVLGDVVSGTNDMSGFVLGGGSASDDEYLLTLPSRSVLMADNDGKMPTSVMVTVTAPESDDVSGTTADTTDSDVSSDGFAASTTGRSITFEVKLS